MCISKALPESDLFDALSAITDRHALFFDIDGTLLDLAATPDGVFVEPGLAGALERLAFRLSGAVALMTGRPLEFVNARFPFFTGAVAALHGTEFRLPSGHIEKLEPGKAFGLAKDFVRHAVDQVDGLLVEDKGNAIALHYRAAPQMRDVAREAISAAERIAGPEWCVQAGKRVFELRARNGDKGMALRRLMRAAPFVGRLPVAFGDDLTDVPMLQVAQELGGHGVAIGDAIHDPSMFCVGSPSMLRTWLMAVAEH